MKETKIIRSGMPFVTAGAAVLLFALIFGMGSVPGYILGIAVDGDVVGYSGKVYGLKLTDDTLSVLVANGSSENVFMGTVTSGTKTITSGSSAVGWTP